MKFWGFFGLIFGIVILGCNYDNKSSATTTNFGTTISFSYEKDKIEIQNLIQQMLKWSASKESIDLLPIVERDSICIGFDIDKVDQNLEKLKASGLFADEFMNNYKRIVQTLDKKIKNKEFQSWNVHELPTFNFANDINPWCLCQDSPTMENIEIKIIKMKNDSGELLWKWKLDLGWSDFKFRVAKEDNKWKISYLEGFDYNESIKKAAGL